MQLTQTRQLKSPPWNVQHESPADRQNSNCSGRLFFSISNKRQQQQQQAAGSICTCAYSILNAAAAESINCDTSNNMHHSIHKNSNKKKERDFCKNNFLLNEGCTVAIVWATHWVMQPTAHTIIDWSIECAAAKQLSAAALHLQLIPSKRRPPSAQREAMPNLFPNQLILVVILLIFS